MSKIHHDINDDEIRIISSNSKDAIPRASKSPTNHKISIVSAIIAVVILSVIASCYFYHSNSAYELELSTRVSATNNDNNTETPAEPTASTTVGYVNISDTIVGSAPLSIFQPTGLTPSLHIGADILNDTTAKFVVQAADIRQDNGGIVGAYIMNGELISKGQSKSGFCAIIGGKINIGVAESTPFLEQALETNGYFFRQYPLVVANQIVENKPKKKSFRKALAELNGEFFVIMSNQPMTFHDFSQSLVDLGVSNAIYLVGGQSFGFATGHNGEKTEFGKSSGNTYPNTNYIVWK